QSHKEDTLVAGRGLCNPEAVDLLIREGAEEMHRIIDAGMQFDQIDDRFNLGLEGGHSNRRVLHANGAATGKALIQFLTEKVRSEENITVTEQAFVFQLLRDDGYCRGAAAYLFEEQEVLEVQSPVTVLATGGYSGLYRRSTNPHTSTGDGLWLACDVGAKLRDLEFVQFHPTAFYTPDGTTFLISEAVRGEGARLFNEAGERFMADHERQELAPRDVVSQEIFRQIENQKTNCVYLDVGHLNAHQLRQHFPHLIAKVEEQGIDIRRQGIPVAPAAHYCIGGIVTDLHGQTTVNGLYACGETAVTGAHGANRLASNSLLECLVFSRRAITHAVSAANRERGKEHLQIDFSIRVDNQPSFATLRREIAKLLSENAGIRRTEEGLQQAVDQCWQWAEKMDPQSTEYYGLRSRGLIRLARLIAQSALQRRESRGVHMRADFPSARLDPDYHSYPKQNC